MIIVILETKKKQFQNRRNVTWTTRIVRKSSSAAESLSEKTCLGSRDYKSAVSLIDNDVLAS